VGGKRKRKGRKTMAQIADSFPSPKRLVVGETDYQKRHPIEDEKI